MHFLLQNERKKVVGLKHNLKWQTLIADKTWYLKIIDEFDIMYSEALFVEEDYL